MEEVTRESKRMKVLSESENYEPEEVGENDAVNDMCTLTNRDDETKTILLTDAGAASSFRFILQNPLEVGHVVAQPHCKYSLSKFGTLRTHKNIPFLRYFISRTMKQLKQ